MAAILVFLFFIGLIGIFFNFVRVALGFALEAAVWLLKWGVPIGIIALIIWGVASAQPSPSL